MQANKKTGAGRLLMFFLLLSVGSVLLFWQLDRDLSEWFRWRKPDPHDQALELISNRYVDVVELDSLSGLPLEQLTSKLDPHSDYIPAEILRATNEDLADHFAGIGIEYSQIRDTVTIAYLMPNSPSAKMGLKTGDQILAIGDHSLVGVSSRADSVRSLVRGPEGSVANLTIRSSGVIRKISIVRTAIPTPAVPAKYMLNDTTGYIKLSKFSEGSYREAVVAIEELISKGMKSLVLDLRNNGGGFMHEAVELADEFLADDRLIVYTEGAHIKRRSYTCKRPGLFEKGKLTILMNELSASASEVLAGALQDWCRAKIIGRRSFGKGLVQEQYELSNHAALRLTVARYYTPLGRCIQRPYTNDYESYLKDIVNQAGNTPIGREKRFLNTCGDTLFAGGGITPDKIITNLDVTQSPAQLKVLKNPEIVVWAYRYYQLNKTNIDSSTDLSLDALNPPLPSIQSYFQKNVSLHAAWELQITEEDWKLIGFEFFAQIARFTKGPEEYVRIQNLKDPFLKSVLSNQ